MAITQVFYTNNYVEGFTVHEILTIEHKHRTSKYKQRRIWNCVRINGKDNILLLKYISCL